MRCGWRRRVQTVRLCGGETNDFVIPPQRAEPDGHEHIGPRQDAPEFIAYVKSDSGLINTASAGNGTSVHVVGELVR